MGENVGSAEPVLPRGGETEGWKGSKMRVTPTRVAVGALTVGAMTIALGSGAWASTSPRQIVKNAVTATEAAKSVTIAGAITEGTETISLNISASTLGVGQGTVGFGTGVAQVRLVGGTVYFMGDSEFWTEESGASAAQLFAGKWVKTAATSSSGQSITQFLNSAHFLKELFSANPVNSKFTLVGSTTVAGKAAIEITGVDAKNQTTGTVYVARSKPQYILKVTIGGSSESGGLTFSHYNGPIRPVAPKGAINIDTLGKSTAG
jgi:hypothetical protein